MDDQPNDATVTYLQGLHPDPFTQAAVWRLFRTAPEALAAPVQIALAQANPPTTTLKD